MLEKCKSLKGALITQNLFHFCLKVNQVIYFSAPLSMPNMKILVLKNRWYPIHQITSLYQKSASYVKWIKSFKNANVKKAHDSLIIYLILSNVNLRSQVCWWELVVFGTKSGERVRNVTNLNRYIYHFNSLAVDAFMATSIVWFAFPQS